MPTYEPNFLDLLTASTDEDARAKAQIIAEQLRGDKQLGMMGQLGGKRAAGLGREMLSDADQAEKGLLTAGVNRLHYGQQSQDLKERMKAADLSRMTTLHQMDNDTKERIAQINAMARLQAAGARQGNKILPSSEVKYLDGLNSDLNVLKGQAASFKDEYAGGMGTNLKTVAAQTLGGSAPKAWQPGAEFWSRYQMATEIPLRRQEFGTALSANEKALWERAKTLTPRSDPQVVRNTFNQMIAVMENKLSKHRESRLGAGYSQEQLDPITSEVAGDGSGGGQKIRSFKRVNGKLVEVP